MWHYALVAPINSKY